MEKGAKELHNNVSTSATPEELTGLEDALQAIGWHCYISINQGLKLPSGPPGAEDIMQSGETSLEFGARKSFL